MPSGGAQHRYLFVYDRGTATFPTRFRIGAPGEGPDDASLDGVISEARAGAVADELAECHPLFRYVVVEHEASSWAEVEATYPHLHFT